MRIGEAAKNLGISTEIIRNWERKGMIQVNRSTLGQRIFTKRDLMEIQRIIQARRKND
jgi:DNA-binding transcriptional MerR regulator